MTTNNNSTCLVYIHRIFTIVSIAISVFLYFSAANVTGSLTENGNNWAWSRTANYTEGDAGLGVAVKNDRIYFVGRFQGNSKEFISNDRNLTLNTLTEADPGDGFMTIYNLQGQLLYAIQTGTNSTHTSYKDTLDSVYVDDNGNVFAAGAVNCVELDLFCQFYVGNYYEVIGPGYYLFIAKFDTKGETIWVQKFETTGFTSDFRLAVISDRIYFTAKAPCNGIDWFVGEYNLQCSGYSDLLFVAMDSTSRSIVWAKTIGTTGSEYQGDIVAYGDEIIISGGGGMDATTLMITNEPNIVIQGYSQIVLMFDGQGRLIKSLVDYGSAQDNFPRAIGVASDSVYFVGSAKGSYSFGCNGTYTSKSLTTDAYLFKLSKMTRECVWMRPISTDGHEYGRGITVGPDAVYISVTANPLPAGSGFYFSKYSFDGDLIWTEPFATNKPEVAVHKLVYSSYSLYLATLLIGKGMQLIKLEMPLPAWTVNLNMTQNHSCDDFVFKATTSIPNLRIDSVQWKLQHRPEYVMNETSTPVLAIPAIWSSDLRLDQETYVIAVIHATLYGRSTLAEGVVRVIKSECTRICLQSRADCRYSMSFKNAEPNSHTSINRMNSQIIVASSTKHGDLSQPISPLAYSWRYEVISSTGSLIRRLEDVNAIVTSPSNSPSFELKPRSSSGIDPSVRFTITLELSAGSSSLVVPFEIVTSPANPISAPTTNALRIEPTIGLSLKDNFLLDSTGWRGNMAYTFSYLDQASGGYIPLNAEESQNLISTTLPAGEYPNYNVIIRVTVLDKTSGDIGYADSAIVVKPFIQKGILAQKTEEAIVSGNYTTAISVASQIRSATKDQTNKNKEELKQVVSDLLEHTLSDIIQTVSSTANSVVVEQQVLVVDMLTKNNAVVSEQSKKVALNAVKGIITLAHSNVTETLVNKATIQRIANVISNVAARGFSDDIVANETVATANDLAKFVLEKQALNDNATTLLADNFELSVRRDTASALSQTPIRTSNKSGNGFQISDQFGTDVNSDTVSFTLLIFPENPYRWTKNDTDSKVSSPIVELTFQYDNGTTIPVADLRNPIMIEFDRSKAIAQGACPEATFDCRYWSEDERIWKTDGCHWINNTATNRIMCACNHTTSFSAFILEKGDSCVSQAGIKITGIVFNSLYLVICIPILIGLFLVRNNQPVRSRFISPYIGISAIIVDSVLQGWIRNSLSLAGKTDASDGFSYVIMLTTNPLTIVALFVFLWQQVRYILTQNIYHLMASASGTLQKGIVRVSRLITSKLLFVIVSTTIGLFVMAYFAILVGLAAHYSNISTKDRDRMVTVQAVSFASMMIFISLAILITLIVDVIFSLRRTAASKRHIMDNTNTSTEIMQVQKAKGIAVIVKHFTDDPLLFRVEACLIIIAILAIIILYSIGIATVVKKSKPHSAIMIVRTIMEIVEMLCKIMAFGGFVFIASVRSYWMKKYSIFYRLADDEEKVNPHDQRILDILRQDDGYNMVYTYCQREFSLENLLLWKDLEELRTQNLVMSPAERKAVLGRINELYMMNNSERQLNISNQARQVFVKVANLESPSVAEAEEAFAKLYGVCIMNLADTFTRLSSSDLYRKYLDSKVIHVELGDDFTDRSK